MASPQPPSISSNSPLTDHQSNDALPTYTGYGTPGDNIIVSVDGAWTVGSIREDGSFEVNVGELADGVHDFSIFTQDPLSGDTSEPMEFEVDLEASQADRKRQRAAREQMEQARSGAAGSTEVGQAGGGGGGGGQAGGAGGPGPSGGTTTTGTSVPVGVGGVRQVEPRPAPSFEKGNLLDEPIYDQS